MNGSQPKPNYQQLMEQIISEECRNGVRPPLLLHACCAPCSSYVLEYLLPYFDITLFFYNPNMDSEEEYRYRYDELCRLAQIFNVSSPVLCAPYDPNEFHAVAVGCEAEPEGGSRCYRCYRLRLQKAAEEAKKCGFPFFTTTLSVSPYKNAEWLNTIGHQEAERRGLRYLTSDFKKKNGYKRSCELSAQYRLYRQDYCGCIYSKEQALLKRQKNEQSERKL